jgi:tetratricopeptide (TPR) repeat protein
MNVSRIRLVGVALVIFAVTVWLHWPSVEGGFLRGDDTEYLQQAVRRNGLTWNAVKWAFTCTESYYQPLVRLSHVLDYQIWGKNAAGHHATSVLVHALNAALVFGFLWTLLGAVPLTTGERLLMAWGIAVVFAIHPLQVESVAWISGRTQLLCTTFAIVCLWAYAAGTRRWVVWGLYAGALLCKPMAVSLPFAMLAIDYFRLRRHERFAWGRLLWEKAVLIAVAVAVGVATMITKSQIGQLIPLAAVPLSQRVLLMFESLTFYPLKLVWPARLSPHYPTPLGLSLDQRPVLASVLSVVIITAVAVVERRRMPMLTAAWGAYLAFILPVSGLMPTDSQIIVAQRYAYVAMLPLLLLAGGAGVWVTRRSTTVARVALVGLLAGELCVFAVRSRRLTPVWRNDETEERAVLAEFPDTEVTNRELALLLLSQGRASEALKYAQRDVEIAPELSYSHMTLGSVLGRLGRLQDAIGQHEQALRLNPDFANAHYSFGVAMFELGKVPEAAEHYELALRIKPDFADAHYSLGVAMFELGKVPEAVEHFEQAVQIKPDFADAHYNLGNALLEVGRLQEAIGQYEQAVRIKPDFAEAHNNLGHALLQAGRPHDAIRCYEQALRITPDSAFVHYNLGNALSQAGQAKEAIGEYEQALRIKPDYVEAHDNLGCVLLQAGKPEEAIKHLHEALRLQPNTTEAHYNLGNVLLQLGRVEEAIEQFEQALKLQPDFAPARNALVRLRAGQ